MSLSSAVAIFFLRRHLDHVHQGEPRLLLLPRPLQGLLLLLRRGIFLAFVIVAAAFVTWQDFFLLWVNVVNLLGLVDLGQDENLGARNGIFSMYFFLSSKEVNDFFPYQTQCHHGGNRPNDVKRESEAPHRVEDGPHHRTCDKTRILEFPKNRPNKKIPSM